MVFKLKFLFDKVENGRRNYLQNIHKLGSFRKIPLLDKFLDSFQPFLISSICLKDGYSKLLKQFVAPDLNIFGSGQVCHVQQDGQVDSQIDQLGCQK